MFHKYISSENGTQKTIKGNTTSLLTGMFNTTCTAQNYIGKNNNTITNWYNDYGRVYKTPALLICKM